MAENFTTNKIICGNAAQKMAEFPNDSVDLTVTSPPYDELRNYDGYIFNFEEIANELYRITKNGGVVVWVVGDGTNDNGETGTAFKQALYFKEVAGFRLHDTMIYWKSGIQKPAKDKCHQVFEYMFVFSKGRPKTFNMLKDRENIYRRSGKGVFRQPNGTITKSKKNAEYGEFGGRFNIWYYPVGLGHSATEEYVYSHPAIFPESLARDLILCWSNPGDIVLDPMCGSGTTPKMAKILNRQYIGIDISDDYCKMSKKRIKTQPIPPSFYQKIKTNK